MREINHQYSDPLDLIWITTAKRLGLKVERSDTVFAAWDGKNQMTLSTKTHFDADDSLAQLILHELCHALIEGPQGQSQVDWGLDNTSERDLVREHACHRFQAAISQEFGLRSFFGVTTEWRPYYDSLPTNPLQASEDPAAGIALAAHEAFLVHPWRTPIQEALSATAAIAAITQLFSEDDSLWSAYKKPS